MPDIQTLTGLEKVLDLQTKTNFRRNDIFSYQYDIKIGMQRSCNRLYDRGIWILYKGMQDDIDHPAWRRLGGLAEVVEVLVRLALRDLEFEG